MPNLIYHEWYKCYFLHIIIDLLTLFLFVLLVCVNWVPKYLYARKNMCTEFKWSEIQLGQQNTRYSKLLKWICSLHSEVSFIRLNFLFFDKSKFSIQHMVYLTYFFQLKRYVPLSHYVFFLLHHDTFFVNVMF